MRKIILDTETTGINPQQGHRIIEVGCIEIIDRNFTGNNYHKYINPQRIVEQEAIAVHGLTNDFLADKPVFAQIAAELYDYLQGAELIIHNAPFDMGFLNHEFSLIESSYNLSANCTVTDTLTMARKKHPGQKNTLDALCKRYGVDNSSRELHGALLDAKLLADVYLLMTGGQSFLFGKTATNASEQGSSSSLIDRTDKTGSLEVIKPSELELERHNKMMQSLKQKADHKN